MLLVNDVCRLVHMILQHCDFRNNPALGQARGMYFNKPISGCDILNSLQKVLLNIKTFASLLCEDIE